MVVPASFHSESKNATPMVQSLNVLPEIVAAATPLNLIQ